MKSVPEDFDFSALEQRALVELEDEVSAAEMKSLRWVRTLTTETRNIVMKWSQKHKNIRVLNFVIFLSIPLPETQCQLQKE